jgi:predicted transcriptional regulator
MKTLRRDKIIILGELLLVLNGECKNDRIVLTQVQMKINVSYDRLKKYIGNLKDLGLIDGETSLKLTEKGKQYLKEYENVLAFIKHMGLA